MSFGSKYSKIFHVITNFLFALSIAKITMKHRRCLWVIIEACEGLHCKVSYLKLNCLVLCVTDR